MKQLSSPLTGAVCDDPDCDCGYIPRQPGTPQDEIILKIYKDQALAERAAYQRKALWCSLLTMILSIPALLGA